MGSNHWHKIGFQDVVYLKSNKLKSKIFKNIDKKTSTWCVKLIRKKEIILFLYHATKCPTDAKKIEYAKNKLTFDFRGQNKTNYKRISFLVLFGLTFEKTTENKRRADQKINLKTRNRIISLPHEEIPLRQKGAGNCKSKRQKKPVNLKEIDRISAELNLVPNYFFFIWNTGACLLS